MKALTTLFVSLSLAASAQAAIFVATMDGFQVNPSNRSTAGGGAVLSVDLITRAWSLSGAISNLVSGATGAAVHGPAPAGQNADPLFALGHNFEPEGPLDGAGILTADELSWLQNGLLYVTIPTLNFPDGEIRGQLSLIPEPGTTAVVVGLGLCALAAYRRTRRA